MVDLSLMLVRSLCSPMQIVSVVVAIVCFVSAYNTTNTALQGTLASVSASFVFLFLITLITDIRTHYLHLLFRAMFGKAAARNEAFLVFPDFVLGPDAEAQLATVNRQLIYQKRTKVFEESVHRVDISRVIADNDLQALVYVAGEFGRVIHQTPELMVDGKMAQWCDASFISFGLSSNDCTHLYRRCAGPDALFEIVPDGNGSEFLRVGGEDLVSRPGELYYGIIVRYHPDPEHAPDRVWMLCAGLGERGTTGAAWYLANRWRSLLRKVGDRDFVAVIKVQPNTDALSKLRNVILQ